MGLKVINKKGRYKVIEFPKRTKVSTINKRFGETYSKGLSGLKSVGGKYRLVLVKRNKKLKGGKVLF